MTLLKSGLELSSSTAASRCSSDVARNLSLCLLALFSSVLIFFSGSSFWSCSKMALSSSRLIFCQFSKYFWEDGTSFPGLPGNVLLLAHFDSCVQSLEEGGVVPSLARPDSPWRQELGLEPPELRRNTESWPVSREGMLSRHTALIFTLESHIPWESTLHSETAEAYKKAHSILSFSWSHFNWRLPRIITFQ